MVVLGIPVEHLVWILVGMEVRFQQHLPVAADWEVVVPVVDGGGVTGFGALVVPEHAFGSESCAGLVVVAERLVVDGFAGSEG